MNLVLIGYRCTGKTSVGRMLAARLGLPFYDTDALIQEDTGRTIEQIVATEGWTGFRAVEKPAAARLALQENCVIALGGGAVLDPENVAVMKRDGRIVWLVADIATVTERMITDRETTPQRPPLQGRDSLMEATLILEERTPLYEEAADFVVDTCRGNIDQIVQEIIEGLQR